MITKKDIQNFGLVLWLFTKPLWKFIKWFVYSGGNWTKWFETRDDRISYYFIIYFISSFLGPFVMQSILHIQIDLSKLDRSLGFGILIFLMIVPNLILRYLIYFGISTAAWIITKYENLPEERGNQMPIFTQNSLKHNYSRLKSWIKELIIDIVFSKDWYNTIKENNDLYNNHSFILSVSILLSVFATFIFLSPMRDWLVEFIDNVSGFPMFIILAVIIFVAYLLRKTSQLVIKLIVYLFSLLPEGRKLKEKNDLNHNLEESTDDGEQENQAKQLKENHIS